MLIPTEKFRQIAERLLAKTKAKEVRWRPHDELQHEYGCLLDLRKSQVELIKETPQAEPDRILLRLHDCSSGDPLPIGEWVSEEGDPNWSLLSELYDQATRVAFGWDRVLEEVESALNSKGPIGTPDD